MTARELIITLVGESVEVTQFPAKNMLLVKGGLFVIYAGKATILLPDPEARDGRALGSALHEACHVLRAQQGVAFYRTPKSTSKEITDEEAAVNQLARDIASDYIAEELLPEAMMMLSMSDAIYGVQAELRQAFQERNMFEVWRLGRQFSRLWKSL